jgi:catalase
MIRFAAISLIVGGIAVLVADAGGWLRPGKLSMVSIINTFEQVDGSHPGFRRNHAKGVCVSRYFESKASGIS